MCANPPASNPHVTQPSSTDGLWVDARQVRPSEAADKQWTPEECLALWQQTNDDYWRSHGLAMNHSAATTPNAPSGGGMGWAPSNLQATPPYRLLLQRPYDAKRRFQRQPPILFRAVHPTGYIRVVDAMNGNLTSLQDAEDSVFSGDTNLSQKQSIRLEIVGCKSYERQINVRNPTNASRSITRKKLAEKVAKEFFEYMKRHQQGPFGDPSLGLGPGTQGVERIILLELQNVSKSSWQIVLGVLP